MLKMKTWTQAIKPFRKAAKKSAFTKDELSGLIKQIRLNKETLRGCVNLKGDKHP